METKERIQQKATELYFRYGIRSITMDEIATHCGMSKKTIYQFFEDKDALVDAVMDAEITQKQCECEVVRQNSDNAIHEVFLAMNDVMALFDSMHASIMLDLHRHYPATYQKLQEHKLQFLQRLVKENIERGQQEQLYRPEANAEILARTRLETVFIVVHQELVPRTHYSPSQVVQEITDHFLYGLATEKGRHIINQYIQERNSK